MNMLAEQSSRLHLMSAIHCSHSVFTHVLKTIIHLQLCKLICENYYRSHRLNILIFIQHCIFVTHVLW